MSALVIVHDVDDVDNWLKSPKRAGLFGPHGLSARTFVDPTDSHRVALFIEGASPADFEKIMQSEGIVDAMAHDGVRGDTLRMLEER